MTILNFTNTGNWQALSSLDEGSTYEIHEANGFNFFYSSASSPDSTIDGTPVRDGERLKVKIGGDDKVISEFGTELNLVCTVLNQGVQNGYIK